MFISGETFGDVSCLNGIEKVDLIKGSTDKSPSISNGKLFHFEYYNQIYNSFSYFLSMFMNRL